VQTITPFLIFLALYGTYAGFTYRDYSVTWDEGDCIRGARDYISFYWGGHKNDSINATYSTHNYIYSVIPVALAENDFNCPAETFHLINMLFALFLYFLAYLLFFKKFKNGYWALMAPLFLLLTPTLTGHIPANYKDAPFAVVYCSVLIIFDLLNNQLAFRRILILGAFIGIASSFRLLGLTLIPILLLYDFWNWKITAPRINGWRWLGYETACIVGVIVISQFVMALAWPYLGYDYFGRIGIVLNKATDIGWKWGSFYFGKVTWNLPWHYLPVWILISTPLFILFFTALSVIPLYRVIHDSWFRIATLCLSVNLLIWITVRPVIYHGIRHYLFLIPVLSLLAGWTFVKYCQSFLKQKKKTLLAKIVVVGAVFNILATIATIAMIHPYEYAYYNELAGGLKGGVRYFEGDYWVNSVKESIAWIKHDMIKRSLKKAKITGAGHGLQFTHYFVSGMEYCPEDDKTWDYFISNSRDHILSDEEQKLLVHTVSRMGAPLAWVFYRHTTAKTK